MNDIGLLKQLFRYSRALKIIPIALEIVLLIQEICFVKFSSMISPKNFWKATRSKEMLLKVILMLIYLSKGPVKNHII